MTKSVKKGHLLFIKIISCIRKDSTVILIHDPAVSHGNNIVKASPLVHAESKGTVLHLISEGKLHLIAVFIDCRAFLNPLKRPLCLLPFKNTVKKSFHLAFLDLQLFLIRKRNVSTASTGAKMGAGTSCFQRRFLRNLQKPAFRFSFSHLIDSRFNLLSRKCILYYADAVLRSHDPLIGEINSLHCSFNHLSFFHNNSYFFCYTLFT